MPEPTAALQTLRASTADLVLGLRTSGWTDADVAAASLCDGWTRGHVLTHLARNADGIAGTLAGALRGEIVARYPDGWAARDAAIDAGAARPVAELIADVAESAERLDRVIGAVGDADAWEHPSDQGRVASEWISWRCREVEIHRVDLAGDYPPDRWPPFLIGDLLPTLADGLTERTSTPLVVTVTESPATALAGRSWTVGDGSPVEVAGPDWAVLAWLAGRPTVAADFLTATPPLSPW